MVTGLDEEGGAVVTGLDEGQTGLGSQKEEEEEARALILRSLSCTLPPLVTTWPPLGTITWEAAFVVMSHQHLTHSTSFCRPCSSPGPPKPGHPQSAHFSPLRPLPSWPPTSCPTTGHSPSAPSCPLATIVHPSPAAKGSF